MIKRSIKKHILFAAAAVCMLASAAHGDPLPNEDTSVGAMHFTAPAQYSTVRRLTDFDAAGTVKEKRLVFGLDDAWWLTLRVTPIDDPSYDLKEDMLQSFHEESVSEAEAGGQTVLIGDDGDELYAFIFYESHLYVVDYEEEAADTADRAFLDSFLSGIQFSGSWEDSPAGDDSLGTMGYTTPELTYKGKTTASKSDQQGNLTDKFIEYWFESVWDRLFLEWYPGKTYAEDVKEEKRASAKELEIAGTNAWFVPYDEEKYGDSVGTYYVEQEDGLYEITPMFDPATDQKDEMLARLLDTIYFSDTAQVTIGEMQELISEPEEEETEAPDPAEGEESSQAEVNPFLALAGADSEAAGSNGQAAAGTEDTQTETEETPAAPANVYEQILDALDNDVYRQEHEALAGGFEFGPGYSGQEGEWLQITLNALGSNLEVDGAAGEMTFNELHFYQDILGFGQTDYVDYTVYERLLPAVLVATDVAKADEILQGAELQGTLSYEDIRARILSLQ